MKRREFARRTAVLAFPAIIPASVLGQDAPSKKITVGFIGTGSHGIGRNVRTFLQQPDARLLAVCDVFKNRMGEAKSIIDRETGTNSCAMHADFREILERKDIDAVMISTPDHWHALMSAMALRRGKDVICEKPTLTIAEGRYIADLVKKTGRVFQTSTEDRSLFVYHRLAEAVRNGRIGRLERIEVRLPAGRRFPVEKPTSPPEDFDWDLWLGPAPDAPYTPSRTEPQNWRHIWDYSGGKFSDWGMHQLDTSQWANDSENSGPVEVEGSGTVSKDSIYNTFIDYELNYTYANGVKLHVKSGGTSLHFHGDDGWCGSRSWDAGLEASDKAIVKDPIPADGIHLYTCKKGEHRNFLDCVRSRREPYFPAETGHRVATVCHMGNVSMLLGRKLRWDPAKEVFADDDSANAHQLYSRRMREPWDLRTS